MWTLKNIQKILWKNSRALIKLRKNAKKCFEFEKIAIPDITKNN